MLAICLAAIAVALAMVVAMAAREVPGSAGPKREYLYYLALTSLLLLGVTLVMLGWIVVRFVVYWIAARRARSVTPYVDAWSLAGKRFQLKDPDENNDEKDGDGPDEDGR